MAGSQRTGHRPVPPAVALDDSAVVELDGLTPVAPIARVHRSRLAIAVSMTVAAVPVLVVDNLPATAEADHRPAAVVASAEVHSDSDDLAAPTSTVTVEVEATTPPTTVPAETTTTAAPATTTTTEAPADPEPAERQISTLRGPSAPTPVPTTTTAPPQPAAATSPSPGDPSDPATWDRLARCESGGNWAANTGNGYYGGLQFSLVSWQEVGGAGHPHEASRAEQIKRGKILQSRYGWGQWPSCARKLGY